MTKSVNRLQLHFVWQATIAVCENVLLQGKNLPWNSAGLNLLVMKQIVSTAITNLSPLQHRHIQYPLCVHQLASCPRNMRSLRKPAKGLVPLYGPVKYLPSVCLLVELRFKEVPRDSLYRVCSIHCAVTSARLENIVRYTDDFII